MSRIRIKKEILSILSRYKSDDLIIKLGSFEPRHLIGPLFSALCSPIEKVRWNAVHAFGYAVPELAKLDLEKARIVMRRFLWSLNDESGGIGWGAPESMAMILCQDSVLRREYLHMLISYMRGDGEKEFQDGNYLELPMLQRGLLWGIGLLLKEHNQEMVEREIADDLVSYLDSTDYHVVGLAMRAISFLPDLPQLSAIEPYITNTTVLSLYENGVMVDVKISELASGLLESQKSSTAAQVNP